MTRTRLHLLLAGAGLMIASQFFPARGFAQPPVMIDPKVKPTTRVASCTASGCHAEQMNHKVLHGPTAVSACDVCHDYQDPALHTFKAKRLGVEQCTFCHLDQGMKQGAVVHDPFAKGNCTGCHSPHGAETRAMLKKPVVSDSCVECHAGTMKGSHAHEPAAKDCTQCHKAHASDNAKLLVKPTQELCKSCHEDVVKSIATLKHPHKPAQGDCTDCHSPHATDFVKVLKKSPRELCLSCHEGMTHKLASVTVPHGAVTDEASCTNCHSGHASDHPKQLLKDPVASCLACHGKPIVVDATRTVPAANEVAVKEFHQHGPIKEGDCGACHDVHGGTHADLLVEKFDKSFYQKYTESSYTFCFKCHERSMVIATPTGEETGFRNGPRNLHALHVRDQGRSCVSCHNVHASRNEAMVADSVTFGQWDLPLNFVKTPTGGSCAPGCHKPETYERGAK